MKISFLRHTLLGLGALLLVACAGETEKPATASEFSVPVTYYQLDNGLKVILSRDTTAPTVIVAVYYLSLIHI